MLSLHSNEALNTKQGVPDVPLLGLVYLVALAEAQIIVWPLLPPQSGPGSGETQFLELLIFFLPGDLGLGPV